MINHLNRNLRLILPVLFMAMMAGCREHNNSYLELVFEEAQDNRSELEIFLAHYHDDRHRAAEYSIEAMLGLTTKSGAGIDSLERLYRILPKRRSYQFAGTDLESAERFASMPLNTRKVAEVVNSEYLSDNLDDAWKQWKQSQWADKLTVDEFCEYILPYKIGDEPLSSWRRPYRQWLSSLNDSITKADNPVDAARIVSEFIKMTPYNAQVSTPHRSALKLLETPIGYCREDCDRTTYAMRAIGIPVVTDMMIVSPDNTVPHQWNAVYDTDDHFFRLFDNGEFLPTKDSIHNDRRRKGKVYRQTFRLDLERLKKFDGVKNVPTSLLNPRMRDVTAEYFGENEAEIKVDAPSEQAVYLGLFGKGGYLPIDIGQRKKDKVIFKNIEPNVIYFPITAAERSFVPCGYPFLLKEDGDVHFFKPELTQVRTWLERKYPRGIHTDKRLASLCGLVIQNGFTPSGPWKDIAEIAEVPHNSFARIALKNPISGPYLRVVNPRGTYAEIAEIIVSEDDKALNTIPVSVFLQDVATDDESEIRFEYYKKMTDNNVVTWGRLSSDDTDMIIKIHNPKLANNLFLVAHNDDNFVLPGQEYELLYFERSGWKSLGRKISDDFSIEFDAPENAVLLLKNHTKGKEEQIFIFRGGKQLFNADITHKYF